MEQMDDITKEFLEEGTEELDNLERDLVELERNNTCSETIARIFRSVHTLKGTSGFLGFQKLEQVAHAGENLLSLLRDGQIGADVGVINGLLSTADAFREILDSIKASGAEGDGDYTSLIDLLEALTEISEGLVSANEDGETPDSAASSAEETLCSESLHPGGEVSDEIASDEEVTDAVTAEALEPNPAVAGAVVEPGLGSSSSDAATGEGAEESAQPVGTEDPGSAASDAKIRVDVKLLDNLMSLAGELVLARNQVLQMAGDHDSAAGAGSFQRLNQITSELQDVVMKTRMQPIGNIWNKYPRIVRDLAQACDKKIDLHMEGQDTELDKTLLEGIKDPLTHLVRNSADHGIEQPECRREMNKAETGQIHLKAYHEGGKVNIEITDDGKGIDVDKIRNKALEAGLIDATQAERMSDRDLHGLIFHPGLSTAAKVTNISGRGVGMDVVKTKIEAIGGNIEIISRKGVGTTIKLKIPLTLAIIPALIVSCGADRFAIPQVNMLELVRLESADEIESIDGSLVCRLRGDLLPVVFLSRELQLEVEEGERHTGSINIVVLQAEDRQFGLVVDEIRDTEEIVVKPLGKVLKGLGMYAGATIMGDGVVALILDVMGIAHSARVISEGGNRKQVLEDVSTEIGGDGTETVLIVELGEKNRLAIPLSKVSRLEVFDRSRIEQVRDRRVVQYRGEILPLVSLRDVLDLQAPAETESSEQVQIVVHAMNGRNVGFEVESIRDIVTDRIECEERLRRPGVKGAGVVMGKVTDIVDLDSIMEQIEIGFAQ